MSSQFSIGADRYRLGSSGPANAAAATQSTGLQALPTPSGYAGDESKPWHPSNPMFAFGLIAAATVGLMAVSTSGGVSLRVGKAVANVSGAAGVGKAS